MKAGDRVALAADPTWVGEVEDVRANGLIDVALDHGGKALGMTKDDLTEERAKDERRRREEAERHEREKRAKDDKSWPPKGLETKVPKPDGAK